MWFLWLINIRMHVCTSIQLCWWEVDDSLISVDIRQGSLRDKIITITNSQIDYNLQLIIYKVESKENLIFPALFLAQQQPQWIPKILNLMLLQARDCCSLVHSCMLCYKIQFKVHKIEFLLLEYFIGCKKLSHLQACICILFKFCSP